MKKVDLRISEINSTFQFYTVLDGFDKRKLYSGHSHVYNKEVKCYWKSDEYHENKNNWNKNKSHNTLIICLRQI